MNKKFLICLPTGKTYTVICTEDELRAMLSELPRATVAYEMWYKDVKHE